MRRCIFLNEPISGERIAVCDFGIARDLESATDALMLTTVHEAAMTPAYAAPEQRPGAGQLL